MPLRIGPRTSILLEREIDFDIDFTRTRERDDCGLRAMLELIKYSGDDIGSQWNFKITINSEVWQSGPLVLPHDQTYYANTAIADQIIPATCGVPDFVSIVIEARETSGFIDDYDHGGRIVPVPCNREPYHDHVLVHMPVNEWYPVRWVGGLRFQKRRTADLIFSLRITTQCKE